jgi:hypothetical protein
MPATATTLRRTRRHLSAKPVLFFAFAFAVMADPVSSVAYAIEAALRALGAHLELLIPTMGLVIAIIALITLNYSRRHGPAASAGRSPERGLHGSAARVSVASCRPSRSISSARSSRVKSHSNGSATSFQRRSKWFRVRATSAVDSFDWWSGPHRTSTPRRPSTVGAECVKRSRRATEWSSHAHLHRVLG